MDHHDAPFHAALSKLLVEIFDGPPRDEAYLLNPGDPGLLRQLDGVSAADASRRLTAGTTTIAAHVDHVTYGIELLNRWARGEENPWADANWTASWRRGVVDAAEWSDLRAALRCEYEAWRRAVDERRAWTAIEASGALASAAHTAYHLGAIRQLLATAGLWKG